MKKYSSKLIITAKFPLVLAQEEIGRSHIVTCCQRMRFAATSLEQVSSSSDRMYIGNYTLFTSEFSPETRMIFGHGWGNKLSLRELENLRIQCVVDAYIRYSDTVHDVPMSTASIQAPYSKSNHPHQADRLTGSSMPSRRIKREDSPYLTPYDSTNRSVFFDVYHDTSKRGVSQQDSTHSFNLQTHLEPEVIAAHSSYKAAAPHGRKKHTAYPATTSAASRPVSLFWGLYHGISSFLGWQQAPSYRESLQHPIQTEHRFIPKVDRSGPQGTAGIHAFTQERAHSDLQNIAAIGIDVLFQGSKVERRLNKATEKDLYPLIYTDQAHAKRTQEMRQLKMYAGEPYDRHHALCIALSLSTQPRACNGRPIDGYTFFTAMYTLHHRSSRLNPQQKGAKEYQLLDNRGMAA